MQRYIFILLFSLMIIPGIQVSGQENGLNKYDGSWKLSEGFYKVRKGNNYGIAAKDGTLLVPCEFSQIWDLGEDNIVKVLKGNKIGLYTLNGVKLAPPVYNQIWGFENGKAKVLKNGKIGFIDKSGREIIPPVYDRIWNFENGMARVLKNGKIGYIDESGHEIIPPEYTQIWDFKNGKARVYKNGYFGYIDENGNTIIPVRYTRIWDFENGRAMVYRNGYFGYINENGDEIIPVKYSKIWDFRNGKAMVYRNGYFGYINENGDEIIPVKYSKIWDFKNGMAKVYRNGKFGYIDEKGNEIIPVKFDMIGDFNNDMADAILNGKKVKIDKFGKITDYSGISNAISLNSNSDVTDTTISIANENTTILNDSIFNDSTVVRIWSDRVEIVNKKNNNNPDYIYNDKRMKELKKAPRKFKGHWSGINIGYNNLITSDGSFNFPDEYMYMNMNAGKSVGVALNMWQQSINLQRRGNIGLVTGLGVEWNNYRFDSQYILTKDETTGETTYYTDPEPINKNKLTTIYLNAPILLEFQIPTGGHQMWPLYFSAGATGGVRLGSHTKIIYSDDSKQKYKDNFNLTRWRYGLTVRAGYRAINIFADYYFSPLFEKDKGPELYQVSAGILIYLDM
ncbi:MAG: outer membrane beta-barrel protein [Chlorobi bacterium]|nr:outer membrane beta-barrel protein [Chlorobiota bacterium]